MVNGRSFTVVGIAPYEFTGTYQGYAPDIYVPMMMQAVAQPDRGGNPFDPRAGRYSWWLNVMGRLKPGISRGQAEAAMTIIGGQIARENPCPDGSPSDAPKVVLDNGSQGFTTGLRDLQFPLKMLMVIVALVLLIACANVANLLLARASARHKEIAIRLAIGSGRTRLIRQLLTESLLLAMIGGIGGLILAVIIGRLLVAYAPPTVSATALFSISRPARAWVYFDIITGNWNYIRACACGYLVQSRFDTGSKRRNFVYWQRPAQNQSSECSRYCTGCVVSDGIDWCGALHQESAESRIDQCRIRSG